MRTALTLSVLAGLAAAPASAQFSLTVLHNGDAESQLINAAGQPDFGGVARFKTLLDSLRAGASTDGVLALNAGDSFLAGPEYTVGVNDGVFYEAVAFAALGYDASAIGNHEFDFGPDVLEGFLTTVAGNGGTTTFVSNNLGFAGEPGLAAREAAGQISRFEVFDFGGTLVGVIGATTPDLPFISSPRNTTVNQMVAAEVQNDITTLQGMGVNIIVLVSHLQGISAEAALVQQTTGLDIVVAGGGDDLLANPGTLLVPGDTIDGAYPRLQTDLAGRTVRIVSTDANFKYVGRLIADFDAAGEIVSVDSVSGPVRVSGVAPDAVTPDAALVSSVVTPVAAGVAGLAANVLATSEVGLDGRTGVIRSQETALGNLIADAFLFSANQRAAAFGLGTVEIAMANGGGIRNNNIIPAGPFTELNSFEVLPFLNFVSVIEDVTPERLKLVLENACSRITTTGSGSGNGRFAQIAGLTYEYNLIGRAAAIAVDGTVTFPGDRVQRVVLDDGTVIIDNGQVAPTARNVNLAIVDFLARGGDQYPLADLPFTTLGVTYQQSLAEFVTQLGTVSAAEYPMAGQGRIVNLWQQCPADANRDGLLAPDDFSAWMSLFNTNNQGADQNRSGTLSPADFSAWIQNFNAGC
jgi:5'-nucleotidase